MILAQLKQAFNNALGDPVGTRFDGTADRIFLDCVNDSKIWLIPRLPVNLMPDLQGEVSTTGNVSALAFPADYFCSPSVEFNSVEATYYPRKKLTLMKNHYYASSDTDPCWTIRNGKYEVLHTFAAKNIKFRYIKALTRDVITDVPEIAQQILLEKMLNWICEYDREVADAEIHLKKAISGIQELGGKTVLENYQEGE